MKNVQTGIIFATCSLLLPIFVHTRTDTLNMDENLLVASGVGFHKNLKSPNDLKEWITRD